MNSAESSVVGGERDRLAKPRREAESAEDGDVGPLEGPVVVGGDWRGMGAEGRGKRSVERERERARVRLARGGASCIVDMISVVSTVSFPRLLSYSQSPHELTPFKLFASVRWTLPLA